MEPIRKIIKANVKVLDTEKGRVEAVVSNENTDAAVFAAAHHRKMDGDFGDAMSGSIQAQATVDGILDLYRQKSSNVPNGSTREYLASSAEYIRRLGASVVENTIAIGIRLIQVKAAIPHGQFLKWIEGEFEFTVKQCQQLMQVGDWSKNDNLSHLPFDQSALYVLAAPSAPGAVRQEAIERAERGEWITHETAKLMLTTYQKANRPSPLPIPSGLFDIIYADPPWEYDNQIKSWGRPHYTTPPCRLKR